MQESLFLASYFYAGGDFMSKIQVSDLTFYYDGSYENIFEHVSFTIDTDWKLGLVGRNGKGKTTLLKLLMGEYEYRGSILKNMEFDYFPFMIGDKNKLAIDIIEEVCPNYELWKICREMTLLNMNTELLYQMYDSLSYGEQTKILLAVLFSEDRKFLLIDEPTNHLDMETRTLVMKYLNKKKGFILVSHDRWFLDGCIDHILAINRSDIEVVQGSFTTWFENKARKDAWEQEQNEQLKKDIVRLSSSMQEKKMWSDKIEKSKIGTHTFDRGFIGAQSARMMKRSKVIEQRISKEMDEKKSLLKNVEEANPLKIIPLNHYKKQLVHVNQVSIFYQKDSLEEKLSIENQLADRGFNEDECIQNKKRICKDINFTVSSGERILLKGENGCGKSSLLKILLGEDIFIKGEISMASNLIISYVPQSAAGLKGNLKDYLLKYHIEETLFKTLLRKLDFGREQFDKSMEQYSEGQKKKVLLAKSLCEQAHIYIWDEPLNYIDVFSRMQIEDLIMKYCPTMIFVEHDKTFSEKIATKVVEL